MRVWDRNGVGERYVHNTNTNQIYYARKVTPKCESEACMVG